MMKIDHIAIWAADLELLRAFYMRYFDMECGEKYTNFKKKFSSYFLTFPGGGTRLEIMNIEGEKAQTHSDNLKGLAHFAISVGSKENVDSMARRFREDGGTILSGPRTTGDGYYECAVADPEGNCIEITV